MEWFLKCVINEKTPLSRPDFGPINGGNFKQLVQLTGVEPARVTPLDPKSSASANSATFASNGADDRT